MNTNRIFGTVAVLIVLMQSLVLFKQFSGSNVPLSGGITRQWEPPSGAVREVPPNTYVKLEGLPMRRGERAEVLLIEFSDYECPFCARHATGVGLDLMREFVETGKLGYAFANLPLEIHTNAVMLASAAICAGEQDHYWEMHDRLFAVKPNTKARVLELAKEMSVGPSRFQACMDKTEVPSQINQDLRLAKQLGITGTPTFVIGRFDAASESVQVQKLITGAVPLKVFTDQINIALSKPKQSTE